MNSLKSIPLIIAALTVFWGTAPTSAHGKTSPSKPNIVLLFVDDLGQADISYRSKNYFIPQINALAKEGMTFSNAYSAAPTCSPSRSAFLTGQHPARLLMVRHIPHGIHTEEFNTFKKDPAKMPSRNWLPLEIKTYGDALRHLGYTTGFIGKWHLGDKPYFPIHHGFDEQFGVTESGHPRSYYPPYFPKEEEAYREVPKDKYLTDKITDDAVAYILKQNPNKPFSLTVSYYSTHAPHVPRKDLLKAAQDRGVPKKHQRMAAMIGAVDESIGRIRDALKEKGFEKNTILVFSGDQGNAGSNAPLRGSKTEGTALYDGGARVPLIIHWPGTTTPGSISDIPTVSTDIFPTVVQMAGGTLSRYSNLDGLSLKPLLTGKKTTLQRKEIFLYRSYDPQYAVIRDGDWKLVAFRGGRMELYNLANDLSEEHDLSEMQPERLQKMISKLIKWEKHTGVYRFGRAE